MRFLDTCDRWQGSGKAVDKGRALIGADEKGSVLGVRLCVSELFEGRLTGRVASSDYYRSLRT